MKKVTVKSIIIDELKEQGHLERVEDVIYTALRHYSDNVKGTRMSAIAFWIAERIDEETTEKGDACT